MDQVIAAFPGSVLSLQSESVAGLILKSTYTGSLNCQLPKLYKITAELSEAIALPKRFQGGEAELCADDNVQLVTVNNTPALFETEHNETDNRLYLYVAVRSGSIWGKTCRLSIETTPLFGITRRFCNGAGCQDLERFAVEAANSRHAGNNATYPPRADDLTLEKQNRWTAMKQLAEQRKILDDNLPTFGKNDHDGSLRSFVDWKTVFMPVEIGNDLLLGKIGTAGFGIHYGSDKLFAAYRLVDHRFQPVAGFHLSILARSLDGVQVDNNP